MMFKRSAQRYGKSPEPVTPYQKAEQMWDERIGSARVQAKNWRLMAFLCPAVLCPRCIRRAQSGGDEEVSLAGVLGAVGADGDGG